MRRGWTWRDRVLTAWADAVTARPRLVLALCLLLTGASIWLAARRLEFQSDRSALIDPSLVWQQRYAEFKRQFPRWDDAVVVVERGESELSRAAAEVFIASLEARLRAEPLVNAVTAGIARSEAPPGLLVSEPLARVEEVVARLSLAGPVLAAPALDQLLGLSALAGTSLPPPQRADLRALLERAHGVAQGTAPSVLGGEAEAGAIERLVSGTGRLAFVLVHLDGARSLSAASSAEEKVNAPSAAIAALRAHVKAALAEPGAQGVRAGVTGVPVLEADETTQASGDGTRAGVLSLALITVLMLIAYRGFVVPMLAVGALLIGMAWSFAWATLAVGHLQLLSITFASLLLGLGIDVAIHIIARLELVHPDHDHLAPAIARAFRGVGPGIITASVTVAAAAGAMALTRFAGVGEMGLIAAGGILLCTLSIMCALPAALMLMPRPQDRLRAHDGGESRTFMGRLGPALHRRPWQTLALGALALCGAAVLAAGVRYDTDLQKLMPEGTESVQWQHAMERDDAKGVWHAVVTARDAEEARRLVPALRALDVVSDVGGAGILFPSAEDLQPKLEALARLPDPAPVIAGALAPGAGAPDERGPAHLARVAESIARRWASADPGLSGAAGALAGMPEAALARVLEQYRADRLSLARRIEQLRAASLPAPDALPPALRELMIGRDGGLLLRVYAHDNRDGGGVLSPEHLARFATSVLGVAPQATGPAIQIFESTRLITRAYLAAGAWALLAIVVLLLLDFGLSWRGVGDTLCALLPVFAGSLLMLAVMALLGVDLNFANMIVTPLIVGIGVGCGVHAVRRWRLQPFDEPAGLAGGSGRAITLTTLTTVIGFAAMIAAEHRGIRSLGLVMSVGLTGVWAVTIFMLPSVLALRGGVRERVPTPPRDTLGPEEGDEDPADLVGAGAEAERDGA